MVMRWRVHLFSMVVSEDAFFTARGHQRKFGHDIQGDSGHFAHYISRMLAIYGYFVRTPPPANRPRVLFHVSLGRDHGSAPLET